MPILRAIVYYGNISLMEQLLIPSRGDVAPLFAALSVKGNGVALARLGGKRIILCFFGDLKIADGLGRKLLEAWFKEAALFDGKDTQFIAIGYQQAEASDPLFANLPEGINVAWDTNGEVARAYGVMQPTEAKGFQHHFLHFILDIDLTVASVVSIGDIKAGEAALILNAKEEWNRMKPFPAFHSLPAQQAPVLIIPNVFEPALCQFLIDGYEKNGGISSGFMREENGKTVLVTDPSHKIRSDWIINDPPIQSATKARIFRRIVPHIAKAFHFNVTRIERFIVACYDAKEGGHFNAHRDNTTKGTAHRRFAVTINLNAEDFEGGELNFPEYGRGTYRAPTGGAVVFSCSLMHRALPVTKGKRYCFLPFLYDEAAAKIREENIKYLGDNIPGHKT